MNKHLRVIALAAISTMSVAAYAVTGNDAQPSTATAPHPHQHHMMHRSPFLMAVNQLSLTADQRQQIHSILEKSHTQAKADWASHKGEFSGLLNPGDPNYANAVKSEENAAVAHIDQRSQENQQIYNLLTPDQQAKLPQALDQIKARAQQRRTQWQAHQNGTAAGTDLNND